jgi:hypothetical protein
MCVGGEAGVWLYVVLIVLVGWDGMKLLIRMIASEPLAGQTQGKFNAST